MRTCHCYLRADAHPHSLYWQNPSLESFPDAPHMEGGPNVRQTMQRIFKLQGEQIHNPSDLGPVTTAIIAMARGAEAPSATVVPSPVSSKVAVAADGAVSAPSSGTFDVTVSPGEPVQAAVNGCPAGGSVLLLPGIHDGPLVIEAGRVVHVFGRGQATLRTSMGEVLTSWAATATVDGLTLRREPGGEDNFCVWIKGGRLRLQACDLTCASRSTINIDGGADPVIAACKCVWVQRILEDRSCARPVE